MSVQKYNSTFFLNCFTVPTITCVNTDLKLELHINAMRYFDSSKVRGEGNSVIFVNRKSYQDQRTLVFGSLFKRQRGISANFKEVFDC